MSVGARLALVTLACVGIVAIAYVIPTSAVQSKTHSVTSLADDGPGTLRFVLSEAVDGDAIEFDVVGAIKLESPLVVFRSVTIRGPAWTGNNEPLVRLDGSGTVAVMRVDAPDVTVENVAVTNGYSSEHGLAGGITDREGLTIRQCLIADNRSSYSGGGLISHGLASETRIQQSRVMSNTAGTQGGGYYGGGFVEDTVFGNNTAGTDGGGLYFTGGLVTRSAIVGNSANRGAGVFVAGKSTLSNTTIALNSANRRTSRYGESQAEGGGLYNGTRVSLKNSSVVENSADRGKGGGLAGAPISGPIGGAGNMEGFANPLAINSIISGNRDGNCALPIVDAGSNLQYPGTECGESIRSLDPQLGEIDLASHSPGAMPGPSSPALNAGNQGNCDTAPVLGVDQRGNARPVEGAGECDIGALEANPASTPTPGYTPAAISTPMPADLVPFRLWPQYSYHCRRPGEHYYLEATYSNVGEETAGAFTIEVDGERQRFDGVLSPGARASSPFAMKNCPCTLTVDVDDEVPELFQFNNAGTFHGVTLTPPPECTVEPTQVDGRPAAYLPFAAKS